MRPLTTYLLVLTLVCLAGSIVTGLAAWNAQIADTNAQKENDQIWLSELDEKVNRINDIEQLRSITHQLNSLTKSTNSGYVELKDRYQSSLSTIPEILTVITFLVGFAWWRSRKGGSSA